MEFDAGTQNIEKALPSLLMEKFNQAKKSESSFDRFSSVCGCMAGRSSSQVSDLNAKLDCSSQCLEDTISSLLARKQTYWSTLTWRNRLNIVRSLQYQTTESSFTDLKNAELAGLKFTEKRANSVRNIGQTKSRVSHVGVRYSAVRRSCELEACWARETVFYKQVSPHYKWGKFEHVADVRTKPLLLPQKSQAHAQGRLLCLFVKRGPRQITRLTPLVSSAAEPT